MGPWEKWAVPHAPVAMLSTGWAPRPCPGPADPKLPCACGSRCARSCEATWSCCLRQATSRRCPPAPCSSSSCLGELGVRGPGTLPPVHGVCALPALRWVRGRHWCQPRSLCAPSTFIPAPQVPRDTPGSITALGFASSLSSPECLCHSVVPRPLCSPCAVPGFSPAGKTSVPWHSRQPRALLLC